MKKIEIVNARHNNLKSISLNIPRGEIVIFTGVSGSGKSSLVFDIINGEAQRQLYSTFSTFVQGKLPSVPKPDCDLIANISPSIVLKQKRTAGNSKSTVGTSSDIYSYLRLLFSRIGSPLIGSSSHFSFNSPEGMCTNCNGKGSLYSFDFYKILDTNKSLNEGAILFPEFKVGSIPWKIVTGSGFFDLDLPLKEYKKDIYDKLLYGEEVEISLGGEGGFSAKYEGIVHRINRLYINVSKEKISKKKNKIINDFMGVQTCNECNGARLNKEALGVLIGGLNIHDVSSYQISELLDFVENIKDERAALIVEQIKNKCQNLIEIGLDYLSLSRELSTLSGGENQRVKLANQLGSSLTEMMYILDEPSTGLHPHDVFRLNDLLRLLKNKGNSVLVVEHDPDIIEIADHIVDMGPHAGVKGGTVVYQGSYEGLLSSDTLTGKFLKYKVILKDELRMAKDFFPIENATSNNLKDVSVNIPKNIFVCVTGVAGSGKSSLINKEFLTKYPDSIVVNQSPVGQSERSNTATYTGLFDLIREEFSNNNSVKASLFSFNSDGACKTCKGLGFIEMEMAFLDPVRTTCEVCNGTRYEEYVLDYKVKEKSISEVLAMTIDEALNFFDNLQINKIISLLQDVGLSYLTLGQPLSTLSGGECQRIKLSKELVKEGKVYILDEPTTGLHVSDTRKIIAIMNRLIDNGNSLIVIEHNLDVIAQADWIIDIGPSGGKNGGQVVFEGSPRDLINCKASLTGKHLKSYLDI